MTTVSIATSNLKYFLTFVKLHSVLYIGDVWQTQFNKCYISLDKRVGSFGYF